MTNFPKWSDVRAGIVAGSGGIVAESGGIVAESGGEEAVTEARRRNQACVDRRDSIIGTEVARTELWAKPSCASPTRSDVRP
ncbi:hypothetical protein OHA77_26760 [Streptosporangium sp. NBC_01639]|uniref:hypothetical protein n=1 Tax=Streptosporangium sp. NBC_01639 TaxID=2975948 RepID=UPI0038634D42|nr:hypothetical protein OHA77_26760 [Streptosporangium sp. NBC_01639]